MTAIFFFMLDDENILQKSFAVPCTTIGHIWCINYVNVTEIRQNELFPCPLILYTIRILLNIR